MFKNTIQGRLFFIFAPERNAPRIIEWKPLCDNNGDRLSKNKLPAALDCGLIKEVEGWHPRHQLSEDQQTGLNMEPNGTKTSVLGGATRPCITWLILYPMNALVEDQLSRLRAVLDSDEAHDAYAKYDRFYGGNRITFGRFNGETPVSGHPIKQTGGRTNKRSELKKRSVVCIQLTII